MSRIRLSGGRVIDPANQRDSVGDVWIEAGRIIAPPTDGRADTTHDVTGKIVMAGAIDIHSHIAGGNINTARLLLPEEHKAASPRRANTPLSNAGWSTFQNGCLYARMGFTTVIEPAVAPHHALHAHMELADTPVIDKGLLAVLGNDDFLLKLIRDKESPAAIRDYVAATLGATKALGLKVINAGAATAFKYNQRGFSLDDIVPFYGVSSRAIVEALQRAVIDLGVPHPLHVHCNNLGIPGSDVTLVETIKAARGLPLHLAHIQFYAYGQEGTRKFSSAAPRIAEAVNAAPNVTVDVGQVMFGQTVTVSSDVMRQFTARGSARPKKSVIFDGDSNGGGVVPFNYKRDSFYNALQWAAGLELFLLIKNPAQVFFTTDHPNGAPYTTYPEVFALLMSRDLRAEWIASLPKEAMAMTTLPSLTREYSLNEIALMTRAAPAKLLGLKDRGSLAPGMAADIAVYDDLADRAAMFRAARLVFKDGALAVKDGDVLGLTYGKAHRLAPGYDSAIDTRLDRYYDNLYGLPRKMFGVPEAAIFRDHPFAEVACAR
jgi:formylmethanofuran dehydrogenase subunit A